MRSSTEFTRTYTAIEERLVSVDTRDREAHGDISSRLLLDRRVLVFAEEHGEMIGALRRLYHNARRSGTLEELQLEIADCFITSYLLGMHLGMDTRGLMYMTWDLVDRRVEMVDVAQVTELAQAAYGDAGRFVQKYTEYNRTPEELRKDLFWVLEGGLEYTLMSLTKLCRALSLLPHELIQAKLDQIEARGGR